MENVPITVCFIFGLTVIVTLIWFYAATKSKTFLGFAVGWTILQSIIGLRGIYQNTEALPPPLILIGIFLAIFFIVLILSTARGKAIMDQVDLKTLTYFHSIRLPVEIVLSLLFYYGVVSVYMTFEGTNFDLFSGITAPIVAFMANYKNKDSKRILLWWNFICLLLLLNVVITAVFAFPSPFQKLALDQPNIAILYFPFNLLPTVIVPIVLFAHLVAIRTLLKK